MLRMEIALFWVMAFVACMYFTAEKQHNLLHRIFSVSLVVMLMHLVFDAATWYAVDAIMLIRLSAYLTAAVKYRRFASLHTYLNKLSGLTVFCIPFLLLTPLAVVYCYTVCAVVAVAAWEELVMHLHSPDYDADRRSILQKHPSHQKNGAKTKDAG